MGTPFLEATIQPSTNVVNLALFFVNVSETHARTQCLLPLPYGLRNHLRSLFCSSGSTTCQAHQYLFLKDYYCIL